MTTLEKNILFLSKSDTASSTASIKADVIYLAPDTQSCPAFRSYDTQEIFILRPKSHT